MLGVCWLLVKLDKKPIYILAVLIPLCIMLASIHDGITKPMALSTPAIMASGPTTDPVLSAPGVNATFGYVNRTMFNFTVTYTSPSNLFANLNVTVTCQSWNQTYAMQKANPAATNYVNGVSFSKAIVLPQQGNYNYSFVALNGVNATILPLVGALEGPSVVTLRNYTVSQLSHFQWLSMAGATSLLANNPLNPYYGNDTRLCNLTLYYDCNFYGQVFNQLQDSIYGYLRFNMLEINDNTNYRWINITNTDANASYAFIALSGIPWAKCANFNAIAWEYVSTPSYFAVEENLTLYDISNNIILTTSFQFGMFLNGTLFVNYATWQLGTSFSFTEHPGVCLGDGKTLTMLNFTSSFTNRSYQFNYVFQSNVTNVSDYSLTPTSGNQATPFTFGLFYRNAENRPPFAVVLTLGGQNYTMTKQDPSAFSYEAGLEFTCVVQFLPNSSTYKYSYSVLSPDGWYNSSLFSGPIVSNLTIENYYGSQQENFEFYDISTTGTVVSSPEVNISFPFTFYGLTFQTLQLYSAGFIRFTNATDQSIPTPGTVGRNAGLTISILNQELYTYDSPFLGSYVSYEQYAGKLVFCFFGTYSDPYLSTYVGDFELILHSNGDIVISFIDLYQLNTNPGGVNFGDGIHYTTWPFTTSNDFSNTSYLLTYYRQDPGVTLAASSINSLYTTSSNITFTVKYTSPNDIPFLYDGAYCSVTGINYSNVTEMFNFSISSTATTYSSGIKLSTTQSLPSGLYNVTFGIYDIFRNLFTTTITPTTITPTLRYVFEVNNPPVINVVSPVPLPTFAANVEPIQFVISYHDDEGFPPQYLYVLIDDTTEVNFTLINGTASGMAYYGLSLNLSHGMHTYSIHAKDPKRPGDILVVSTRDIDIRYTPDVQVISGLPSMLFVPETIHIEVAVTTNETGFSPSCYLLVDGQQVTMALENNGTALLYSADISLGDGSHRIQVVVTMVWPDGEIVIIKPASDQFIVVNVINLPFILGIIGGAVAGVFIVFQVRRQRTRQKLRKQALLKKNIIENRSVVPTQEEIEEKRRLRQEIAKKMDGIDAVDDRSTPVVRSAAVKKAVTGSSSRPGTVKKDKPIARPAAAGGRTTPKDSSKYAPRPTDTGTILNRTILKEYVEKMRREGVKELHYLKIKNDLNVISKNKSSKLYRLLQLLVEDNVLVRKGSVYVIVG
jgi:hypothetical protein